MRDNIYCGPAPEPSGLWNSWNMDAPLLLALLTLMTCIFLTNRAAQARVALACALATLVIAFVSPLCALASALFSARVAHHVLLVAVSAPLLVLSVPNWRFPLKTPLVTVAIFQALIIWLWHAPSPYTWALSGTASYWLMEISLLVVAFWFWREVLSPYTRCGAALGALFGTVAQMGLLGAILTFARTPLYDVHAGVTTVFGLTQLEDQQLAGLIMWAPAAIPYLLAAAVILARFLPQEQSELRRRDA